MTGDVTNVKEEKLAQNAEVAASVVVKNLLLHANRYDKTALYTYVPTERIKLISLGKYDAVFVWYSITFGGIIPAIMKEFVEWWIMTEYRYRTAKMFHV